MTSTFWALTKKEYRGFINSPMAYVIIVPFLLLINFLFFRTALVMGDANLRPFIELLPWFLIVIGPALAMRSFSDEQRRGTLELLFAHPLSEWTIVLAKFTGLFLFYLTMLLSTLLLPVTLIAFSRPDPGLMLSQYLGAALVGLVFSAVGVATATLIASAVGSFLLGAAINFGLMLLSLNFIILMLPGPIARFVSELAIQNHLTNFSRGVVDLRDLLYYLTLGGVALTIAVLRLSERKVAESKAEKSKLTLILGLLIGIGLFLNLLLYEFPLQLDLTHDRRYSLSSGTRQLLKELPDRVTLTLYTSNNLPGPMQVTLRDTSDVLKDFKRVSSKLQLKSVLVSDNPSEQADARKQGIREVQFNQIGSSTFQVQTGYLGLTIRYADKQDIIDFIEDAGNLEYELSRRILKLTRDQQPKLGLIQATDAGNSSVLTQLLSDQYQVVTLSATSPTDSWADLNGVVILDDGTGGDQATPSAELKNFFNNNGGAVFFIDGVAVNQQSLTGTPNTSAFINLLPEFGLTLKPDLVFDMQRNEAITLGSGNSRYIVSYPFWLRAVADAANTPWAGAGGATLGWASSLTLNNLNGWQAKPLLTTSPVSGTQTETFTLSPNSLSSLTPTGQKLVVAALTEKAKQRVAVVADTQVASDDFLSNSQENGVFVSNLIDWVAADPILLNIPRRTAGRTTFNFASPDQIQTVQIVNIIAPPLVVSLLGFWWLHRRKQLTKRIYEN